MAHQLGKLAWPLLCLFSVSAHAASFDCSKASTTVERVICSDADLSKADEELAVAYEKALHSSPQSVTLREQQRRWLNEVRNRCKDASCLTNAYRKRIQALSPVHDAMTDEKAANICAAVLRGVNDGSMQTRFVEFQPASEEQEDAWRKANPKLSSLYLWRTLRMEIRGVTRTFGLIQGGGTCSNCDISEIGVAEPAVYPMDQEDEDLRWAGWGGCDQFIYLMDEPIVVSGQFSESASRAGLVSWLSPDGAKRPLCVLEPTAKVKTVTKLAENKELCRAAAIDAVTFLPWMKSDSIPKRELEALEIRADSAQGIQIDIDLDGKRELLALLDYASGAGCGSYHQWLVALTPQGRLLADSPLNKLLRSREWGPIEGRSVVTDERASVRVFEYKGKPYILGGGIDASASVVSLWRNQPKIWCKYRLLPEHLIKRHYSVETRSSAQK